MHLSRGAYILLIVLCTDLILVGGAALVLWPTGLLSIGPLVVLAFLLAWKALIAGVVLLIGARWQMSDQLLGFNGYYMGRIIGLLLGGIVGGKYGGVPGGLLLAIVLYLLVAGMGRRLGFALDAQGRRLGLYTKVETVAAPPSFTGKRTWLLYAYALGLPVGSALISVFFAYLGITAGANGAQYLPQARLVVLGLSLVSILIPWLLLRRTTAQPPKDPDSFRRSLLIIGAASSGAPAVYGILLLVSFGASLAEALMFALVSAAVAVWWITAARRSPLQNSFS